MATLKVRGIHSSDTASEYSSDEVGTIDDTFLFPKWWDKKANNVEYIRCFKMHMERVCDDIDVIIPANADVEIRGAYDGNLGFRIDYHRGVKRMAITAHDSTQVDAEYIFPTRPGQQPMYKEYGAGPVACFDVNPLGSWSTFYAEHKPHLDLGGYEAPDGFYDLNEEPDNITNLGGLGMLGPFSAELYEECITIKRDEYLKCRVLCESDYCKEVCDREYEKGITYCKIEHNHPDVAD